MCAGKIIQFILSIFLIVSGIAMLFIGENAFVVAPSISANNPLLHGIMTDMALYTLLKVTGGLVICGGILGTVSVTAPFNVFAFYLVNIFLVIIVGLDIAIIIKAIVGSETTDEALTTNLLEKTYQYDHDMEMANAWDSLHDSSSCCGVEGPFDWLCSIDVIPSSCCPADMTVDCDGYYNEQLYQQGCVPAVRQTLTSVAKLVGTIVTIQIVLALSILTGKVFQVPYC